MAERILGPQGSRRRRRFAWVPMLLVACIALLLVTGAQAVHDTGAFELDGNAVSASGNAGTAPDDWDRVCHQVSHTACPSPIPNTNGATAVDWRSDGSLNATIFTGGGSKDPQDINQWAWKNDAGGLPDKDNLLHSFAARYSLTPDSTHCPSGGAATCDVLFFGSDRYDNSGDAQQGFWFFQNAVGLGTNSVGGGTGFTGVHKNKDLLIISDFSNGGATATITVYEWNTACKKAGKGPGGITCGDQNLQQMETSTSAKCAPALGDGDQFCGIVNPSTITMPWSFTDKSSTPNNGALNGEFYEGGINLSTLGLAGTCFASVASETRSSTSTTATLKDFVLGGFGDCTSGLTTTPSVDSTSIGTGSVSVSDSAQLNVGGAASWTGTLTFFLCGPIDPTDTSQTCDGTTNVGTQIGSAQSISNSTVQPISSDSTNVTSAGFYCWRGVFHSTTSGVPDANDSTSDECFTVTPVQPTISTSASSSVVLGSAIDDTATLGGTSNQPDGDPAGGTITFSLYGPSSTATCGTAIATSVVNVSGDGDYSASDGTVTGSLTPTSVGTYYWIASYSGDSPNTLSVAGACGDTGESSVVTDTSSASSAQTWRPNDTATIHSGSGSTLDHSTLSGTITIQLYTGLNCVDGHQVSGQLYTSSTLTNATSPQSFSTSNTTYNVTATSDVSWLVSFNPAAGSAVTASSHCENSSLTVTN